MNFSGKTKVKEIALANPGARQVLETAGVDYCCAAGNHCTRRAPARASPSRSY